MKKLLYLTTVICCLLSCNSSLNISKLNKKFIESEKPLSDWDKDLINKRNKAINQFNVCFDSINDFYLIETYDVGSTYYSGLLYFNENNFFLYYYESLKNDVKIPKRELTNTEKFIINELKRGDLKNIQEKSLHTDILSPITLYITVAKRKSIQQFRIFKYQEFLID